MATLLTGLGLSLLVLGSLLAVPYVRSRFWGWTSSAITSSSGPAGDAFRPGRGALDAISSSLRIGKLWLGEDADYDASPRPGFAAEPALPTRLQVPSLTIDAPIVPVSSSTAWVDGRQVGVWDVPKGGAVGWHEGSAPLGKVGNTVLNGHNTTGGEVFRELYTVAPGDALTIYSGLEPYTYVVSATLVLPEAGQSWDLRFENASLLEATLDERITLVTCHPYGSLRNRLIVIAVPRGTGGSSSTADE